MIEIYTFPEVTYFEKIAERWGLKIRKIKFPKLNLDAESKRAKSKERKITQKKGRKRIVTQVIQLPWLRSFFEIWGSKVSITILVFVWTLNGKTRPLFSFFPELGHNRNLGLMGQTFSLWAEEKPKVVSDC